MNKNILSDKYKCGHDISPIVISTTVNSLTTYMEWQKDKSGLCLVCWLKERRINNKRKAIRNELDDLNFKDISIGKLLDICLKCNTKEEAESFLRQYEEMCGSPEMAHKNLMHIFGYADGESIKKLCSLFPINPQINLTDIRDMLQKTIHSLDIVIGQEAQLYNAFEGLLKNAVASEISGIKKPNLFPFINELKMEKESLETIKFHLECKIEDNEREKNKITLTH